MSVVLRLVCFYWVSMGRFEMDCVLVGLLLRMMSILVGLIFVCMLVVVMVSGVGSGVSRLLMCI